MTRVAAIEHLLVLKPNAFSDRKGSAKGDKNGRDVLRICSVAHATPTGFRPHLALPYLRDDHLFLLAQVTKGPYATTLANGNAQTATWIRECTQEHLLGLIASSAHAPLLAFGSEPMPDDGCDEPPRSARAPKMAG